MLEDVSQADEMASLVKKAIDSVNPDISVPDFVYGYWLFCSTHTLEEIADDMDATEDALRRFVLELPDEMDMAVIASVSSKMQAAGDITLFVNRAYGNKLNNSITQEFINSTAALHINAKRTVLQHGHWGDFLREFFDSPHYLLTVNDFKGE